MPKARILGTHLPKIPRWSSLGEFKVENMPIAAIGKNRITARKILDRGRYK